MKIVRSYLKPYENAIIDGSTAHLIEAATDGWDAVVLQQSMFDVDEAMNAAIKNNHLSTLRLLRDTNMDKFTSYDENNWLDSAALYGHTDIIFAINDWNLTHALNVAASVGHFETVTRLLERVPSTERAIIRACQNGHLAIAKKLIGTQTTFKDPTVIRRAVMENGLVELMWIQPSMPPIYNVMLISRHPRMVDYLLHHKLDNPDHLLTYMTGYADELEICIDRLKSIALCIAYGGKECDERALGPDANAQYDPLCLLVMQCLLG